MLQQIAQENCRTHWSNDKKKMLQEKKNSFHWAILEITWFNSNFPSEICSLQTWIKTNFSLMYTKKLNIKDKVILKDDGFTLMLLSVNLVSIGNLPF